MADASRGSCPRGPPDPREGSRRPERTQTGPVPPEPAQGGGPTSIFWSWKFIRVILEVLEWSYFEAKRSVERQRVFFFLFLNKDSRKKEVS